MLLENIVVQQCRMFLHGWKMLVMFFFLGGGFFLGTPAEQQMRLQMLLDLDDTFVMVAYDDIWWRS